MSYIGNAPVLQTTQFRDEFPVTASTQTAFATSGFHPNAVSVYRNGVLLAENGDYTKGSDNVTITLTNAAVAGDIVVVEGRRDLTQGLTTTESRYEEVIANNATTVTTPFPLLGGYTDVFINGVRMAQGVNNVTADYSINTSTNVVSFTTNPVNGDLITVVTKNQASSLVALPLKDSAGNNVLSESGGTVTLANVNLSSSVGHGYTTILEKDFTLSSGTNTQLNYTSGEIIDELSWHSTSTNTERITVDRDGIYLVTLNCFDIDAINRAFVTVNHYSSSASLIDVISQDITTDTDSIDDLSLSGVFKMDANSFVQCVAYQLSGSDRTAKFTFTLTLIKEL